MKIFSALIAALLLAVVSGCGAKSESADEHGHASEGAHAEAGGDSPEEGAHGGRKLEKNGITVELAIEENGTEPHFRAWLYQDEKPLPAKVGAVQVDLTRLGGAKEKHVLIAQTDGSFKSSDVVAEPHSFDVEVKANVGANSVDWTYASYEGRTEIERKTAIDAGIVVAPAAKGVIADEHAMQGLLTPIEGRTAKVMARFPGPIRRLDAKVGDAVTAGRSLATIESNLSLTNYSVTAPISGVVLSRDASVGGVASEGMALFEIADLSSLWVDLHIFGADAQHIRPGVPVTVTRMSDGVSIDTVLERILPGTATASQSTVARATVANKDGLWRPGTAVQAKVTVDQQPADLVVPLGALQTYNDENVVYVRVGDIYEVRPVELGKRDGEFVQVTGGINAGDEVVVEQSYLVKADIEKSGASHEH